MTVATVKVEPSAVVRRARTAVALLFLTNGALFANLVPRYPQIKAGLELDNTAYGLAIAASSAGALLAGPGAALLIRRFGSARVAVAGTILTAAAVSAAAVAPSVILLAAALFLAGAVDANTDVAQNAHGLRVQKRYGRSIINSFHAIWSIGAVLGGAMAAGAIALDLSLAVHLGTAGVLFSAVALLALRYCLPGPEEEAHETPAEGTGEVRAPGINPHTVLLVAALVLIAISGVVVEDAGASWAALYLSGTLGASATLAAAGFIALMAAHFLGRITGDRLFDRFGPRNVVRAGGLIAAAGMGLALAFPTLAGTIIGFAAAGFGVATLVPAAMNAADDLPGLRAGTGLTLISWLMRIGFLLSPPLIGMVADATGLRTALLVVPIAGVVAAALAGVLQKRPQAG